MKYSTTAHLRLFCIGGAGQNSFFFAAWRNEFPDEIELCPLELPGRLRRCREQPIDYLPALATLLAGELAPLLEIPYAFFGHSMGALIAFELSRALRKKSFLPPVQLFASGSPAPQYISRTAFPRMAASDKHFTQQILAIGVLTPEIVVNPALLQVILPVLRADFKLCHTYQYTYEPPFHFPISMYYGRQEYWLRNHVIAWKSLTAGSFKEDGFDGDHHYLRDNFCSSSAKVIELDNSSRKASYHRLVADSD
jgi:medium-chain acyl-[acyl-carrier-protein] hydrolase